jgi:hypothetical protein
MIKQGIVRRSD